MSTTYTEPDPIVRGEPLKFHLEGVMHQNQFVKDFCYKAYINGKIIDDKCYKRNQLVYKDAEYTIDFNFDIPPYIPPGDWRIRLVVRNTNRKELSCLGATFHVEPQLNATLPLMA
eukprot:TRINITY_DN2515_c0_g2_i2.p1 TRINITY_DN2515_c0_g2~~TRINITY_DN2515_c0_g2_i2.p1  ORF type:complete len:115 (+),score=25.10 TRINITY_DN2515_c0_g2_i2:169-513(+)